MFPDGAVVQRPPGCRSQLELWSHWMLADDGHPAMHTLTTHSQPKMSLFHCMRSPRPVSCRALSAIQGTRCEVPPRGRGSPRALELRPAAAADPTNENRQPSACRIVIQPLADGHRRRKVRRNQGVSVRNVVMVTWPAVTPGSAPRRACMVWADT